MVVDLLIAYLVKRFEFLILGLSRYLADENAYSVHIVPGNP